MRPRARYGFLGALRSLYTPNFIPGTYIPPSPLFYALIARLGASNRLREERNGNYVYLSPDVIFFRNYNPAE